MPTDNVDDSRREAAPAEDDNLAERIVRDLERLHPNWRLWHDEDKRQQFTDELRELVAEENHTAEAEPDDPFKMEVERQLQSYERTLKSVGFCPGPSKLAEFRRMIERDLRQKNGQQRETEDDDLEFLRSPQKWNRAKKF